MDACIDGPAAVGQHLRRLGLPGPEPRTLSLAHHVHVPDAGPTRSAAARGAVRRAHPRAARQPHIAGHRRGERPVARPVSSGSTSTTPQTGASPPYGDRVAICAFEEVLADPSIIARRLNDRYGTSFNDDPMSEEEKRDVVERLEANEAQMRSRPAHGTVPNPHKQNLQPLVRSELERHMTATRGRGGLRALGRRHRLADVDPRARPSAFGCLDRAPVGERGRSTAAPRAGRRARTSRRWEAAILPLAHPRVGGDAGDVAVRLGEYARGERQIPSRAGTPGPRDRAAANCRWWATRTRSPPSARRRGRPCVSARR